MLSPNPVANSSSLNPNIYQKHLKTKTNINTKQKSVIVATNHTIRQIVKKEIAKYGLKADLNHIDTSQVTHMRGLFSDSEFNGDISKWDFSHVEDASCMFYKSKFNGDISQWDVGSLKIASYMFFASEFNQDISNWNVKNLLDSSYMFAHSKFNQDISHWNMENVGLINKMFFNNYAFQHNLSHWKMKKIQSSMKDVFTLHPSFNLENLLLVKEHNKAVGNLKVTFDYDIDFNLSNKDHYAFMQNFILFVKKHKIPLLDRKKNQFLILSPYPFLICNVFYPEKVSQTAMTYLKDVPTYFYLHYSPRKSDYENYTIYDYYKTYKNLDLLYLLLKCNQPNDSILKELLSKDLSFMLNKFEELTSLLNKMNLDESQSNYNIKNKHQLIQKEVKNNKEKYPLFTSLTQLFFEYEKQLIENKNKIYFDYLEENNKSFSDFYPYYSKQQKNELLKLKNASKCIDLLL